MRQALELDEQEYRKLKALYRSSGIQQRHSVLKDYQVQPGDFTFYPNTQGESIPSVAERMEVYRKEAPRLACKAVDACFTAKDLPDLSDITHLVTVSCTGMYAPGLDIDLVHRLGLTHQVKRTAVNFMGCYGAFNGLKLADSICQADNRAKVLVVSVELCTLHFRHSKREDDLLSAALFADGAACVLVEGKPSHSTSLEIGNFYCDLFPQGSEDMAWNIGNDSFIMRLSSYIPDLVGEGVGHLVERLLEHQQVTLEEVAYWAVHPGGKRILRKVEDLFHLTPEQEEHFGGQLGDILSYFQKLSAVDVEGVEPMAHAFPVVNVLRADEPGPTLTPEQALQNAPKVRDGQLSVPRVVAES